tara:strand:- start:28 stop:408 length:381 start_codon:yes stop_codon:yes gene_type:complete
MKPLLVEILESILRTDGKLAYRISGDDEEVVGLTRDTSLACDQKDGDEYVGMSNLDEGRVEIFKVKSVQRLNYNSDIRDEDEYIGFIYWTNFNEGVERLVDNSCKLDDEYGLNEITRKWEEDYRYL